jgi:hypothetical protein
MGNLTDEDIKEYAMEAYCICIWDSKRRHDEDMKALHLEHMKTDLKIETEREGGTLIIHIRHPTKHNRRFKCSIDIYDVFSTDDFCDVITNTIVEEQYAKEEFQSYFMTSIINRLQDDDSEDMLYDDEDIDNL